jgi:hypothetical protein
MSSLGRLARHAATHFRVRHLFLLAFGPWQRVAASYLRARQFVARLSTWRVRRVFGTMQRLVWAARAATRQLQAAKEFHTARATRGAFGAWRRVARNVTTLQAIGLGLEASRQNALLRARLAEWRSAQRIAMCPISFVLHVRSSDRCVANCGCRVCICKEPLTEVHVRRLALVSRRARRACSNRRAHAALATWRRAATRTSVITTLVGRAEVEFKRQRLSAAVAAWRRLVTTGVHSSAFRLHQHRVAQTRLAACVASWREWVERVRERKEHLAQIQARVAVREISFHFGAWREITQERTRARGRLRVILSDLDGHRARAVFSAWRTWTHSRGLRKRVLLQRHYFLWWRAHAHRLRLNTVHFEELRRGCSQLTDELMSP